jgi:hypothetical protein
MIGQYLPNNNEKNYSAVLQKNLHLNAAFMRHPHLKTCLLHDCCGRIPIPSQAQILIDIVLPSIHTSTPNIETKVAKFYLHVILLARPYFLRCKACQLGSQSLYRLKGT